MIKLELHRKHPKLEYSATLISFVVVMLTFSDKLLTLCDQEEGHVAQYCEKLTLPEGISAESLVRFLKRDTGIV